FSAELGDDFTVLHSVAWVSKPGHAGPRDGELDFLICHPRRGVLALEVKGGTISVDYREKKWTSTSKAGRTHGIKNPFEQAMKGKYGFLEKLKESPAWQKLGIRRFNLGHAVFLPEIGNADRLSGPDAPRELLGDERNFGNLTAWLDKIFTFWEGGQ